MLKHRHPVNDAKELHCSRPDVGSFADRHEGHEPPVRATCDSALSGSDVAGGLQELSSVNLILQVTSTQVLVISPLKVDTISGRPSDIRRNTDITTGYQRRHIRNPIVLNLSCRAAVRQHDRGTRAVALQIERDPH